GASGPAAGGCGSIMQRVRKENWRLRWERQRRGWSQDDVVDRLQDVAAKRSEPEPGVDRNTVSRWERGISRPTPRYVQLLAAVLPNAPEDGEPWERLTRALERPSPLDPALVTDVETLTASLHDLETRMPARRLIAQVSGHLDRLAELLQGSMTQTLRQRLIGTAGDAAVL